MQYIKTCNYVRRLIDLLAKNMVANKLALLVVIVHRCVLLLLVTICHCYLRAWIEGSYVRKHLIFL